MRRISSVRDYALAYGNVSALVDDGTLVHQATASPGAADIAWRAGWLYLAVGDSIWRWRDGDPEAQELVQGPPGGPLYALEWGDDGLFVSTFEAEVWRLSDPEDWERVAELEHAARALALSPDGSKLWVVTPNAVREISSPFGCSGWRF